MSNKPSVYLCGPIRGIEDYDWRLTFVEKYGEDFRCLIPADIGVSDTSNLIKFKPSSYMTYRTDLHLIDMSDIIIANLLPLDTGYRGAGSLIEIGYAIAKKKLILMVASEQTRKHPFISFGADGVFGSFEELHGYLSPYLSVLSGDANQLKTLLYKKEK
jgi:nucleoside 2-deoxyribosyltransferase